jgi:CBS domain-containing protein
MKASEIMTRDVVTITPDAHVREAAAVMAEHRVTSLPVLDEDGDLIGIVSEYDLLRDRMPHDPRSSVRPHADGPDPKKLVRDVMSDTAFCLSQNCDTADLAELMVNNDVRAVPIVDGARLVGIVSRRDVLRTLLRDDNAVCADVRERLDAYAGTVDRWHVACVDGVVTVGGKFAGDREEQTVTALAKTVPGVVRVHTKHRRIG